MQKLKTLFVSFLICLSSCSLLSKQPNLIDVGNISPSVQAICARHDNYVRADPLLSDEQEAVALQDSDWLITALKAPIDGEIFVESIALQTKTVCARHDAYVKADVNLQIFEQEIYLNTSKLLLGVIMQAESQPGLGTK